MSEITVQRLECPKIKTVPLGTLRPGSVFKVSNQTVDWIKFRGDIWIVMDRMTEDPRNHTKTVSYIRPLNVWLRGEKYTEADAVLRSSEAGNNTSEVSFSHDTPVIPLQITGMQLTEIAE